MASWMVHFRIADKLMEYLDVHMEPFIVGNIGPDCGEPNEDWSVFRPSSNISHWKETEDKSGINSDGFYEEYVAKNLDNSKKSFYIGYYIHLVTDVLWRNKIYVPIKNQYLEQFEKDKNFIWTVKEDWYDLDHMYLKNNPEFRAFRIFDQITSFPNIYLDYFSEVAIEKRIKYISGFYNSHEGVLEREYPYLNEEQMNVFVSEAADDIRRDLILRNIIRT